MVGMDEQKAVGLWGILGIEEDSGIVTSFHARSSRPVKTEPGDDVGMLLAVILVADGRRHVNDSFDQFGFLELGHGLISPQKFVTGQPVAILQGRNRDIAIVIRGYAALSPRLRSTWPQPSKRRFSWVPSR